MTTESIWSAGFRMPRFPKLAKNLSVDVAVVGGGITGITAAYLLKKAGRKVALIERDRCARGDTGHTTAHLTYVTDLRLRELVKKFGRDHARAAWDAGRAAMGQIQENGEREKIACELVSVPGFLHASLTPNQGDESADLKKDAALAEELGFEATYVDAVPIFERPGVCFANQAKFHPLKYLAGLLARIPGKGCHVFENTEAGEFSQDPLLLKANGHEVRCEYLVIATHVPLMGNTGLVSATLFQTKLAPYSTYALGARLPKGKYPEASYWDTSDPYFHLRIDRRMRNDYAILGGADHKTGQTAKPEKAYASLREVLLSFLPDAQVDRHWSGQVIETNDGLPFIGEIAERQFVATGFSGNGMTFGTLSGMMARDAALGEANPWKELFDVGRKKLRGGTWDYLRENIDYPYYMIRDRLAASEGTTPAGLKRGQGQILKLDGQRVAAYRDKAGKVIKLSPVCTHMGCIVHWNRAEATWDCPCHGSRFQPDGSVLAGPAEAPLEEVKAEKNQPGASQRPKRKT